MQSYAIICNHMRCVCRVIVIDESHKTESSVRQIYSIQSRARVKTQDSGLKAKASLFRGKKAVQKRWPSQFLAT